MNVSSPSTERDRATSVLAEPFIPLPSDVGPVRRVFQRTSGFLYPLAALALAILAWQCAIWVFDISRFILPSPLSVAEALIERRDPLWRHGWATLKAILLGFGLAFGVGFPLGTLMAISKVLNKSLYPLLVVSQAIPKVAVAPLFLVWLGFGMTPKVAIAALIAFFPIVISTVVGLQATPIEMVHLVRSMGGGRWALFYKVSLPFALPSVFAGLKIAITFAVVGAVVGEFVATNEGLGFLLLVANGQARTDFAFAAIVALSMIGVLLFYAVHLVELLVIRGRREVAIQAGGF